MFDGFAVEADDTVGAPGLDAGDVVLGNNAHHGSYSCLKVTARTLGPAEFLRASNCVTYWPKTLFHWTFDGGVGDAFPSTVTNAAVSFHDLNSTVYSSAQLALDGNGPVTGREHASYAARTKSGGAPVADGENDKNPRENGGCAYLASSAAGDEYFRTSAYVGYTLAGASSAYAAGRGLSSGDFTAEGFFKFDQSAWLDGIGSYATGRPRLTLMTRTRNPNDVSKSAWVVTLHGASGSDAYLQLGTYCDEGSVAHSSSRGVMVDGRWHHVAVTYDDVAQRMIGYLDYKPFATNNLATPISYGVSGAFYLGLGPSVNNNGFHGWVDEVRYVRECLDPSEFLRIEAGPGLKILIR